VHVSTREGFGLVVSEALWQGTPVIGSRIGGIKRQVMDGENGWLLDPLDTRGIASYMASLLEDPDRGVAMGRKGHQFVRENYLLPHLVKRYLGLLRYYAGVDSEIPHFRYNGLTHREVVHAFARRHPHLPELSLTDE
jgi:trehalose synthase